MWATFFCKSVASEGKFLSLCWLLIEVSIMTQVNISLIILFFCGSILVQSAVMTDPPRHLFEVLADANTSDIIECVHMEDIDSCIKIDINFEVMEGSLELIMAEDGFVFKRKDNTTDENGESRSFSYESDDLSFAVLTYTEDYGYPDLNGRIHYTKSGSSFMIDNCGENCHILIKLGEALMDVKEPAELPMPSATRVSSMEGLDPAVSTKKPIIRQTCKLLFQLFI